MNTKYIFVTGGVVSGLGKGITAASLGRLLKNRGYKDEGVRRKKFFCMATGEIVDECVTGLLKEEFVDFVPNDKK